MRKLINYDFEMDMDDLTDLIGEAVNKSKKGEGIDFEDIVDLHNALDRQIYIGNVSAGLGVAVDTMIRFWNKYDNENNTPIENRKPIKVYIDSCGGSLTDAFTIINTIKMSKTPVYTIVIGSAYSAGFFISIAGHKRYAYPLSSFLYHEGSATNGGTANQFQNFSEFYKKQLKQLKKHTLDCTKISEELYEEKKRDDWWLDANEALELGVIDEISEELM